MPGVRDFLRPEIGEVAVRAAASAGRTEPGEDGLHQVDDAAVAVVRQVHFAFSTGALGDGAIIQGAPSRSGRIPLPGRQSFDTYNVRASGRMACEAPACNAGADVP